MLINAVIVIVAFLIMHYMIIKLNKESYSHTYFLVRCNQNKISPNFASYIITILLDKGLLALYIYRVAYKLNSKPIGIILTRICGFLTGVEIYYNAKIGRRVQIWHGSGVVIGQNAEIGNNCLILQQVTVGGGFVKIGDGCKLAAGAKVVGNISIGKGCVIGANAFVNKGFGDNCLIVGVPAVCRKVLKEELDIKFGTKNAVE